MKILGWIWFGIFVGLTVVALYQAILRQKYWYIILPLCAAMMFALRRRQYKRETSVIP